MPTITAQAQNKHSLLPNIIAFPGPRRGAGPLATLAPAPPPPWPAATLQADVLNETDLAALHRWMETAPHGYGRLHIEQSHHGRDHASFALLYPPGSQWSSWGLARADNAIEVWSCSNGQTLGRFPSMPAALASLPRIPAQT